jgi:hypothetical protein
MKVIRSLLAAAPAAMLIYLAQPAQVLAQPAAGYDVAPATHSGDWTLKQREDWLYDRLHKARDDGSINGHEFDRVHGQLDQIKDVEDHMRDHQHGQLTDDQTARLESRMDDLADHIQALHENAFQRPW